MPKIPKQRSNTIKELHHNIKYRKMELDNQRVGVGAYGNYNRGMGKKTSEQNHDFDDLFKLMFGPDWMDLPPKFFETLSDIAKVLEKQFGTHAFRADIESMWD